MPAEALKCKECCTDLSTRGALRLRALFRPARGRLPAARRPIRTSSSAGIQAGPHTLWRYADFLPLERAPARSLPTGWTPLVRADRLAERLGIGELWIKNETANPTHSFKDRVVSVALARAHRARVRDRRLRVDRQPRRRRRRARRRTPGCPPTCSSRPTSRRRRSSPPAPTAPRSSACAATTTPSTGSAPSSRASARAGRSSTSTCGPYYAEGSKTLAFETAEQLGWELPDRVVAPIASGSLFTKVARGFREFIDAGLLSGDAAAHARRAGRGLLAGRAGVRRRHRRLPPRQARHDRQVARDRQPGRRALRGRAGARAPAARSTRSPTTRSAPASACSPRRPASSPRRPAASTTAVLAKLAERGAIGPGRARRRLHHRRRPEDARRGARHRSRCRDRAALRRVRGGASRGGRPDGGHGQAADAAARRRRRRGRDERRRRHGRRGARARSTPITASCASGSPARTASCAASSTSTSRARTSASSTGSPRRSPTATR